MTGSIFFGTLRFFLRKDTFLWNSSAGNHKKNLYLCGARKQPDGLPLVCSMPQEESPGNTGHPAS